jgi:hypothetical protein
MWQLLSLTYIVFATIVNVNHLINKIKGVI